MAVFGEGAEGAGRHQCAEVKRSSKRRWLRLLGTRQDVQIWGADERAPPQPRAAMLSGALSPWVQATLEPLKAAVPALADPNLVFSLTDATGGCTHPARRTRGPRPRQSRIRCSCAVAHLPFEPRRG